jgi:hypothetical protein
VYLMEYPFLFQRFAALSTIVLRRDLVVNNIPKVNSLLFSTGPLP